MSTNRSSLAVAQRLSLNDPAGRSVQKVMLRAVAPAARLRPAASAPAQSAVGFLLLDVALHPVSFNTEAINVLGYPDKLANVRRLDLLLAERIRLHLRHPGPPGESHLVTEFQSGRRRYLCRAFPVHALGKNPSRASIAVLLERRSSGMIPVSAACQQFSLTRRERESLEYLLQGLSTKEIANRMTVSANTVKAFLRLIMVKMGVSSRSGIVAKILATNP
jgi:DNA-binding CsgD family transcriptional regulator